MAEKPPRVAAGLGVDAGGGPVIDPTANVIALVVAESKRQDDLRVANERLLLARVEAVENSAAAEARHAAEIRAIETRRLDAIRQVDMLAVSTAEERSRSAIQSLATTTATNAENVRNALASTAATIAAQMANEFAGLAERIAALEKSSYEGKGRQAFADPALAELVAEMKSLRQARDTVTGKSAGGTAMWSYIAAGAGFLLTLIAIGTFVFTTMRAPAPAPPPAQVIYVPAPAGSLLPTTVGGVGADQERR